MNSINPYYTCIDISLEQSYVIKFVSASFRKEIPLVEKKMNLKGFGHDLTLNFQILFSHF